MKRILLTCFVLMAMAVSTSAWAQDRTVTGRVTGTDDGLPLPQVTVLLKGTTTGTPTDSDGNYRLSVPQGGGTLVFRYLGYVTQEIDVQNQSIINVQLAPDTQSLGEVVVTGYGTQTKERASISSTTITAEKISARPNASIVQTLSGQIPGLNITTTSGQPGGNSTINLRGVGSINGDTEPLFIIDGIPVDQDNFRSLNPNEIASVSVLKDAGATAIYGNRGSNGVIIIKTKQGGFQSPLTINYTGIAQFSQLQDNDYNLLSSPQQLALERDFGSGLGTTLTDAEINARGTTDWIDHFFRTAVTQNHTLSIAKGGENSSMFISLGYFDQEGVLENSYLERYNLRANLNGRSNDSKFTYGLNLSVNYSENGEPNAIGGGGINQNFVLGAYQSVPYISPSDYTNGRALISPLSFTNTPLFLIDKQETFVREEDEIRLLAAINLSYEILPGLVAKTVLSSDYQTETRLTSQSPESFNAILFAETGNNTPGFTALQNTSIFSYNQVTSLTYTKEFGKHSITGSAFMEYLKAHFQTYGFNASGINLSTYSPGDGSSFVGDNAANDFFTDNANANILESGLFSYFGQADYDYDRRFGVTATIRRDASFRFAESNRWGTFYSVAGRWNLHNEDFMADLPFDIFKVRGSYGVTGNQGITGGGYFAGPDLTRNLFVTGGGYGGLNSLGRGQIGNLSLQWEQTKQANIGFDIEMFDNRFRAVIDVYSKTTDDLFQNTPVSSINGVSALSANVGKLRNSGFDWSFGYDVLRSNSPGGLNLTLNFIGNYNKQNIVELPGGVDQIIGVGRVGGPLSEIFTYRYAGVSPANGNLLFLTAQDELTENPNVDTDRVWSGQNFYPDVQGSFGFDFSYKGFFATAQFNYTSGVDRFDGDYSGFINPNNISQFRHSSDILRAWTPDTNRITDIPSLTATNLNFAGTRFLRDADYIRLRFASIGYAIPSDIVESIGFRSARVFVNGENLFTITEWRGFDAEGFGGSRLYPTPKTYSVGLELGL